jgi:hypothetical protein
MRNMGDIGDEGKREHDMQRFSVWSWLAEWAGRGDAPRRAMEPADMGTAFGLEASLEADASGAFAPWHGVAGVTQPPLDDRVRRML